MSVRDKNTTIEHDEVSAEHTNSQNTENMRAEHSADEHIEREIIDSSDSVKQLDSADNSDNSNNSDNATEDNRHETAENDSESQPVQTSDNAQSVDSVQNSLHDDESVDSDNTSTSTAKNNSHEEIAQNTATHATSHSDTERHAKDSTQRAVAQYDSSVSTMSVRKRAWIMRGLVTPIFAMISVTLFVFGVLCFTIWKPVEDVSATTTAHNEQYIATSLGVLNLVDKHVVVDVQSSSPNVCVALTNPADAQGWLQDSSALKILGLESWESLATAHIGNAHNNTSDKAKASDAQNRLSKEVTSSDSQKNSNATTQNSANQEPAQEVAFADSQMWKTVKCGAHTVSLDLETAADSDVLLIDTMPRSSAQQSADGNAQGTQTEEDQTQASQGDNTTDITLRWHRQGIFNWGFVLLPLAVLFLIVAIVTATLCAMDPKRLRKLPVIRQFAKGVEHYHDTNISNDSELLNSEDSPLHIHRYAQEQPEDEELSLMDAFIEASPAPDLTISDSAIYAANDNAADNTHPVSAGEETPNDNADDRDITEAVRAIKDDESELEDHELIADKHDDLQSIVAIEDKHSDDIGDINDIDNSGNSESNADADHADNATVNEYVVTEVVDDSNAEDVTEHGDNSTKDNNVDDDAHAAEKTTVADVDTTDAAVTHMEDAAITTVEQENVENNSEHDTNTDDTEVETVENTNSVDASDSASEPEHHGVQQQILNTSVEELDDLHRYLQRLIRETTQIPPIDEHGNPKRQLSRRELRKLREQHLRNHNE